MASLTLDRVPNRLNISDVSGIPEPADASFLVFGTDHDKAMHYAIWPATLDDKVVTVRVSTRELARVAKQPFEINTALIRDALKQQQSAIQAAANRKYVGGYSEVTIDLGDLG
jgi:hypothetical protein